ncbi:MAG TPA: molybdopterin-binding protein [Anaeromyxobacter sp.]
MAAVAQPEERIPEHAVRHREPGLDRRRPLGVVRGIAARDRTYEAVAGVLEKRLDGFGELFRMLSYAEIGSAAMLSRATAGVWAGRAVFSVPGSPAAVRLAWEKLIAPEVGHVLREIRKDQRAAPGAR